MNEYFTLYVTPEEIARICTFSSIYPPIFTIIFIHKTNNFALSTKNFVLFQGRNENFTLIDLVLFRLNPILSISWPFIYSETTPLHTQSKSRMIIFRIIQAFFRQGGPPSPGKSPESSIRKFHRLIYIRKF